MHGRRPEGEGVIDEGPGRGHGGAVRGDVAAGVIVLLVAGLGERSLADVAVAGHRLQGLGVDGLEDGGRRRHAVGAGGALHPHELGGDVQDAGDVLRRRPDLEGDEVKAACLCRPAVSPPTRRRGGRRRPRATAAVVRRRRRREQVGCDVGGIRPVLLEDLGILLGPCGDPGKPEAEGCLRGQRGTNKEQQQHLHCGLRHCACAFRPLPRGERNNGHCLVQQDVPCYCSRLDLRSTSFFYRRSLVRRAPVHTKAIHIRVRKFTLADTHTSAIYPYGRVGRACKWWYELNSQSPSMHVRLNALPCALDRDTPQLTSVPMPFDFTSKRSPVTIATTKRPKVPCESSCLIIYIPNNYLLARGEELGRGPLLLEPRHPPDVHFAEVAEGDCFSDQPACLAFHGERQGRSGFHTHHDSLEPCFDVSYGPLDCFFFWYKTSGNSSEYACGLFSETCKRHPKALYSYLCVWVLDLASTRFLSFGPLH